MKREELWLIYIKKNPKFVEDGANITFTVKGLRQFFERTFDQGFIEGQNVEKNKKSTYEKLTGEKFSQMPNFFDGIFNKK